MTVGVLPPFLKIYLFILGCAGSLLMPGLFLSCREQGLLFVEGGRFLIAVASLVAEHGGEGWGGGL